MKRTLAPFLVKRLSSNTSARSMQSQKRLNQSIDYLLKSATSLNGQYWYWALCLSWMWMRFSVISPEPHYGSGKDLPSIPVLRTSHHCCYLDAVSLFIKWWFFCITDRRMITRGEVAPISVEDTPQSLTFVPSLRSEPQLLRSLDTVFLKKKLINGIINRLTWRINKFCICGSLWRSSETVSAVSLPGRKERNSRTRFQAELQLLLISCYCGDWAAETVLSLHIQSVLGCCFCVSLLHRIMGLEFIYIYIFFL